MNFSELKRMTKYQNHNCDDVQDTELLELLWYHYTQLNPIESEAIEEKMASVQTTLKTLSHKREMALMRAVAEACVEYERSAFAEGVRVGGQLMLEMLNFPICEINEN